jgi:EAL domain-containing protein (putative c-di-GMP-specific phosphodiesterase class I)
LSINVSGKTIGQESWRHHVDTCLERSTFDPRRLTFEITETAAIGNIAGAARFTTDLRARGFRLALDDFGAGFGSFYYLKHLPFDDVKIDGEFVRDSFTDSRNRAIIHAMVDVASTMGRRTVAECVEDVQTLELVRSQSVDLAQGFYLGHPQLVDPLHHAEG